MRITFSACILLSLLVAMGCATSSSGAQEEFQPVGSIHSFSGTASYSHKRVVGPAINVSQRSDGSWGGTVGQGTIQPVDLDYKNGKLSGGSSLTLVIAREGVKTVVDGQCLGRILHFEVGPDNVLVRTDQKSLDFPRNTAGQYVTKSVYGGHGELTLEGDAASAPIDPAFALALMGAFL